MATHDEHDPKQPATADKSSGKHPATHPPVAPDPTAGMDREVGDLEDPDAVEDADALPGRMGGGLAGA